MWEEPGCEAKANRVDLHGLDLHSTIAWTDPSRCLNSVSSPRADGPAQAAYARCEVSKLLLQVGGKLPPSDCQRLGNYLYFDSIAVSGRFAGKAAQCNLHMHTRAPWR